MVPFSTRKVSPKLSPTSWCASFTVQPSRFLPLKMGTQSLRSAALCALAENAVKASSAIHSVLSIRLIMALVERHLHLHVAARIRGGLPALWRHMLEAHGFV